MLSPVAAKDTRLLGRRGGVDMLVGGSVCGGRDDVVIEQKITVIFF